MPTRGFQQAIVAVVAVVGLILGIVAAHGSVGSEFWVSSVRVYTISVTTVGLVMIAFDRWLWKLRPLRFGRPRLHGTWRGRLSSTWVAEDGTTFTDLVVHLAVRQTFGRISATLLAERSASVATRAALVCETDGRWHLVWNYSNVPRPLERGESSPHQGTCEMAVGGARGERLSGSYYTDRKSTGEMVFDSWSPALYGDAHSATLGTDFGAHQSLR
jgi:SMODS-associating 2TM, beta-strand rich effector domain